MSKAEIQRLKMGESDSLDWSLDSKSILTSPVPEEIKELALSVINKLESYVSEPIVLRYPNPSEAAATGGYLQQEIESITGHKVQTLTKEQKNGGAILYLRFKQ